ncbi:MAG: tetratricopeptide repeat protein, partial [Deltaproteobacteria bacterium]|nr:tetratricopeptide repeat protein [Deltaproteobacteria bacterium]
ELLRELYYATEDVLSGGQLTQAHSTRVEAAKDARRTRLTDWPEADIEAQFGRGYPGYWLTFDAETHERQARIMRAAEVEARPLTVETRVVGDLDVTEVTIYTQDHPGLFSRIAGAMAMSGASIVDAKIFTMTNGMALDVFEIQEEVIELIVGALAPKVTAVERASAARRATENINAYDAFLRGTHHLATHLDVMAESESALLESRRWFQKAIELDPKNAAALNYLGYTYAEMGIYLDEAEELIVRALKLESNDGFYIDSLGWVYYQKGDYGKAVEQLERAVGLVIDDPTIIEHLGDAYAKLGKLQQAILHYREAHKNAKEKDQLERIQQKIQHLEKEI